MIKKIHTASTLGRRNKQQILDDFVYPEPASVISAAPTLQGGYGGGDIPGCAGGGGTPRPSCAEWQSTWGEDTPTLVGGWGGGDGSGFLGWIASYPSQDDYFDWSRISKDYAGAGGTGAYLKADGSPGAISPDDLGSRVYARVLWQDVSERIGVLYTLSWSLLGDLAETSTQHALSFAVRARDFRSGTAADTPGGFSSPTTDVADLHAGDIRIVWKDYPARGLGDSYLEGNGIHPITPPIAAGQLYKLFIESTSPTTTQATFWRAGDPEDTVSVTATTSNVWPPNLSIQDAYTANGLNQVHFHSALINPPSSNPVVLDEDCDAGTNQPGVFVQNLFRKDYYFRPQFTNVDYYTAVYFDGIQVYEGTNYLIEDDYKIVPNDFALLDDTIVTASGVFTGVYTITETVY